MRYLTALIFCGLAFASVAPVLLPDSLSNRDELAQALGTIEAASAAVRQTCPALHQAAAPLTLREAGYLWLDAYRVPRPDHDAPVSLLAEVATRADALGRCPPEKLK